MFKKLLTITAISFFLTSIAVGEDSPLVEAAKKEKERRAKIKKETKVLTNKDVDDFKAKNKIEDEPEADVLTDETKTPEKKAKKDEPNPDEVQEAYWRKEYAAAKAKIADAEARVAQLETDFAGLTRAFTAEGDGLGQRPVIEQAKNKAYDELQKAKQDIIAARQALEDLMDRGRREGALPGWFRD